MRKVEFNKLIEEAEQVVMARLINDVTAYQKGNFVDALSFQKHLTTARDSLRIIKEMRDDLSQEKSK